MKTYPKNNWIELSDEQKEIFNIIEEEILMNEKMLEWKQKTIDVIAYNSAFTILNRLNNN